MSEDFIEDIIADAAVEVPASEPITDKTEVPVVEKSVEAPAIADVATADVPPTLTVDELATQLGWRADHKGEDAVDSAAFILKSREIQDSMRDHNKDLKSQLNNLKGSVDTLKDHNERVYQAELKKMQAEITNLKSQKRDAIELADVDKVDALDKQINNIEQDLSKPEPKKAVSTNDVYTEWVKDNDWYLTDDSMAAYADKVAEQYNGAPIDRIYSIVRAKVAEVFPEKFDSETPAWSVKPVGPASPVEAATNTAASPSFSKTNLTAAQSTIMKQFVQGGIMTEDQYIKDIAKLQGA